MPGLILGRLFGQKYKSIEDLPPHLRRLAERYRRSIADILGVPPEAIREDVVVRWVLDWAEAYVKPEWRHVVHALIYTYEKEVRILEITQEMAPGKVIKRRNTAVIY